MKRLLASLVAVGLIPIVSATPATAATCTPTDPGPAVGGYFELSTAGHLEWVRASSSRWGSDYRLTADIDMTSCAVWTTTIGDSSPGFTGDFDGNNHAITGLAVTKSSNDVGIFGYISGSTIVDLTLANITINGAGSRDVGVLAGRALNATVVDNVTVLASSPTHSVVGSTYVGGLVGFMGTASVIRNSSSNADVTATNGALGFAGGLVGYLEGTSGPPTLVEVMNSSAAGDVEGGGDGTGGLIGYNSAGIVEGSRATGQVQGDSDVGGLVGQNISGSVVECSARGDVTGASDVGGLVGYQDGGSIRASFATGNVTGSVDETGGLVGSNMSGSSIQQSYATGNVTGVVNVGGLAGFSAALVDESYSTGAVTGTSQVGGFIGFVNGGTTTDSYWDVETSGQSRGQSANPDVATGLTTAQMQTSTSFTGWSITEGYSAGSTWGMCSRVNGGYPFLTTFFSTDPCTDAPAADTAPSYAQLHFTLPDGRECSAIGPVLVEIGTEYALPGVDAECKTSPDSMIDGWTIPVPPGFTGAGSSTLPFRPGHVVDVSGSQQFSAVLWEPILHLQFDANVAQSDECRTTDSGDTSNAPRTLDQWVPRSIAPMARFPMVAPCTPPGHRLTGWNTRGDGTGETFAPGSPLPESWHANRPNVHQLYAMWMPEQS